MLWLLSFALATCPGEPVPMGRVTLYYTSEGGCGNGRDAACLVEHIFSSSPACDGGVVVEERFGGGTSTRRGYYPSTLSQPLAAFLLERLAEGRVRGDDAADLLAHGPPERTVDGGRHRSTATRWVAGAPATPRISWGGRGCEAHEQGSSAEGATCFEVFRGDQVTPQRVDALSSTHSVHLFANPWRNREVFYVLHDRRNDRHTYVARTVAIGPDALPVVVAEHQGGIVYAHPQRDGTVAVEWIGPDGAFVALRVDAVADTTDYGALVQGVTPPE